MHLALCTCSDRGRDALLKQCAPRASSDRLPVPPLPLSPLPVPPLPLSLFLLSLPQDPFVGCGDILLSKRVGSRTVHHVDLHANCFALLHLPPPASSSFLLTACHWDRSFQCISLADGRVVRTIRAHNDIVTCLAGEWAV